MPIFAEISHQRCTGPVEKPDTGTSRRDYKHFKLDNFKTELAMKNWEKLGCTTDVNEMVETFDKYVKEALDKYAPVRRMKFHKQYNPHLSSVTKKLMKDRDVLRKQACKEADENQRKIIHEQYKKVRNHVTNRIRDESRKGNLQRIEGSANEQTNAWKVANEILKPKRKQTITLRESGREILEEDKVAKIFNNFFMEKVELLRNKIDPEAQEDPMTRLVEKLQGTGRLSDFSLKTVSEGEVRKIVLNLKRKKSTGLDDLSGDLLKSCADVMITPLTWIVNSSIQQSIFPTKWKIAKVSPLLKKGDAKNKTNYRPVSLLPVASKVLETVVQKQVSTYFENMDFFPKHQHGFRQVRSTTTALLAMQDEWSKAKEAKENTAILLFDLSAAFDTLDHGLLIRKLKAYGLNGMATEWFQSYLQDRKQVVQIGNKKSDLIDIPTGSPQGAILSPLLFTIFVADIKLWVKYVSTFSYCDDTSISVSGSNLEMTLDHLKEDAQGILTFMSSNGLVANEDKTKFMVIRPSSKQSATIQEIQVGSATIQESTSEKLLGIRVNNALTWKDHLVDLNTTLQQRVLLLRRLAYSIPPKYLQSMADGLILSKVRYGIAVYGGVRFTEDEPVNTARKGIQVLLNNMMRIIKGCSLRDHVPVEEILRSLGLQSLNQMTAQSILLEGWKIMNNSSPSLQHIMSIPSNVINVETKSALRKDVRIPMVKTALAKESFSFTVAKLWNLAPLDLRNAKTKKSAKKEIKQFTKSLPML